MKQLLYVSLIALSGCASNVMDAGEPEYLTGKNQCSYQSIQGNEYHVKNGIFPATLFYFNQATSSGQYSKDGYSSLNTGGFKVITTGIQVDYMKTNESSPYRYEQMSINGEPYKKDGSLATKVVSSDCGIFYLNNSNLSQFIKGTITKGAGLPIDDTDLINVLLGKSLSKIDFSTSKTYDKFTKMTDVKTTSFNGFFIRGATDASGKLLFSQLYVDLKFMRDWGHISSGIDEEGTMRNVNKIHTDIDCSSGTIGGCMLTETVGFELKKDFLERHKSGFDVKFMGAKQSIIHVPAGMISAYLSNI